jgi:hypothetical protein
MSNIRVHLDGQWVDPADTYVPPTNDKLAVIVLPSGYYHQHDWQPHNDTNPSCRWRCTTCGETHEFTHPPLDTIRPTP